MKPTTRYEGDLTTSKLVVEEGAQFRGHVSVGPDAVKSPPAGSKARPTAVARSGPTCRAGCRRPNRRASR